MQQEKRIPMKNILTFILLSVIAGNITAQIKPASPVINKNNNKAISPAAAGIIRYRITINGFKVNTPTADHILEVDGKGDEVFFYTYAQKFNLSTGDKIGDKTVRRSMTFGDINNDSWRIYERVKAGSKPGEQGGLQKGDRFPTNEPWRQYNKPNTRTIPFVISEGTLQKNEMILAVPSVWEYDGTTEFEQGLNAFAGDLTKVTLILGNTVAGVLTVGGSALLHVPFAAAIDHEINQQRDIIDRITNHNIFVKIDAPTRAFSTMVQKTVFGDAKDRPIGMEDRGDTFLYTPLGMKLTYDELLNYSSIDFGSGKGVLPLRFKEAPQLQGDYTLYVQLEVTGDATPMKMDKMFNPDEPITAKEVYGIRNANDNRALIANGEGKVWLGGFNRSPRRLGFYKDPEYK